MAYNFLDIDMSFYVGCRQLALLNLPYYDFVLTLSLDGCLMLDLRMCSQCRCWLQGECCDYSSPNTTL